MQMLAYVAWRAPAGPEQVRKSATHGTSKKASFFFFICSGNSTDACPFYIGIPNTPPSMAVEDGIGHHRHMHRLCS